MDANGLRFWMLADARHWDWEAAAVRYDPERRGLRLRSRRAVPFSLPGGVDPQAAALALLERVPQAIDPFGTRARWDAAAGAGTVVASSEELPDEVVIFTPAAGETPSDLTLGYDGAFYVAVAGRVEIRQLRDRWDPVVLEAPELAAWRLAADPGGGVWVLDRDQHRLARIRGLPFPRRPGAEYDSATWRPCEEDPDPPRIETVADLDLDPGEQPVAVACSPGGRLALLSWDDAGETRLRFADGEGLSAPVALDRDASAGLIAPYSLSWLGDHRLAVLAVGVAEAPVYEVVDGASPLLPLGDLHPLRDHDGGPFFNGPAQPPRYPAGPGQPIELHRLSMPSLALRGAARGRSIFDSGDPATVWHRLYLEAAIPPDCGVRVLLAAGDDPLPPPDDDPGWHEHRFGDVAGEAAGNGNRNGNGLTPRGAWVSFMPSELPFHPGLLACEPEPDRTGLFTVLIQRSGRRVSHVVGRFLWLRLELSGDGRATPEVAAVRAYGSRFSYRDRYLPALYQEDAFGPDADATGSSSPADFLERFLGNFEGLLTPLEDRIAGSYLLTDARTAPPEALAWLASWIGLSFEPGHSEARRRRLLRAAPELCRWHGTARGLRLALDAATGGGVRGGEVVVVEGYQLRRTFATILGADLTEADDPLLGGPAVTGNSFVGDALIMGAAERKELLALSRVDPQAGEAEKESIELFYERLAHRATVLVHQQISPLDLGLIRRVVEVERPAHVQARVLSASHPLLVGMASLVGIDTYLSRRPARRPVRVGDSRLGADYLRAPDSLDPRLGGGSGTPAEAQRPVADAGDDLEADLGSPFRLDAGRSRAVAGRRIVDYLWTLLD